MFDFEKFRNPPESCRGTDFWMLNDTLEPGELRSQLRAMRSQGILSVIARTYIGLKSDYPGPDFMANMKVIVDEARTLDMTVFLQAGYMPEAVLGLPQEFALGDIRMFPKGEGEGERLCVCGEREYRLVGSRTILDMFNPAAVKFYMKQSYEDLWSPFEADFGKTIRSVWVDEPSYGRVSLPWTHGLPAAFESMWGYAFPLEKLPLLFEEGEGAPTLRHHFWRTMLHLIKSSYFAEVRDWCHARGLQFSGHLMAEDTMASQLHATCFTMPLYRYFDIPGIDYLTAEMNWRHGEIKSADGSLDDMWAYARIVTPLQCSSAAHQAGKEQVLCEMYGVSTENLTLRDQRHMFDSFAALGINHRSIHGIFYSLRGRGKRAYPPHIGEYQPYWPQYHLLTDTLARESWFLKLGSPVRDVLVLHPMGSAFCEYRASNEQEFANEALRLRDRNFLRLLRNLLGMTCNFELGDEDTLAEQGSVAPDGTLVVGMMRYRSVVIPEFSSIYESTLSLLETFAARGGQVVWLGKMPAMLDGRVDDAAPQRVAALRGLQRAEDIQKLMELLSAGESAYRCEGGDACIIIHYREDGDDKLFFLCNTDCRESRECVLVVRGRYAATLLRPEDGTTEPLGCSEVHGCTRIPLRIEEGGSAMLRLEPVAGSAEKIACDARRRIRPLRYMWSVERHEPNALVLEFASLSKGKQPFSRLYPVLAIQEMLTREKYVGPVTLRFPFESQIPVAGGRLALESPQIQDISLDGVAVSNASRGWYRARAFELVALPELSPGKHTIEIARHFEPLKKPLSGVTSLFENLSGVELEPMILLADCAVTSVLEPGGNGCVRLAPRFSLAAETGRTRQELVSEGYPFYAGSISLRQTFALDEGEARSRLWVEVEGFNACVGQVYVNGLFAGNLTWDPYRVSLTGFARAGENELEIRITNTLRNLLGPWHRPAGEIGACWAGYDFPSLPWSGALENQAFVEDWYEQRVPDRIGWTESYLLLPFGIRQAQLISE